MITKMDYQGRLTKCLRVCLVLEIVGFLFHTVGYATPYWRTLHFKYDSEAVENIDILIQGFDEGLWRRCVNGICSDIDVVGRDWLQAVRAFETIALLTSFAATFFISLYFIFPKVGENKRVFLASMVSCLVTGAVIMLASITYGASVKVGIGWSFGFVVTGGIIYVIAGLLMLVLFYTLLAK